MTTYKIIRFRRDGDNTVVRTGLSLEEAQAHCKDEATHKFDKDGVKWFDGYTAE